MKKSPPFKPGMFALGFLGAYSLAALILFFTLKESLAGSGTTPRSPAGPEIISDNADLPQFEIYSGNAAPENGRPVFGNGYQSPNPSGPVLEGGLSGDATGSIFRDGSPAPSPANAPPSSFEPNRNSSIGAAKTPHLFGAGLFTAGFTGGSGTPPEVLTPISIDPNTPIDPSDPFVGSPGPGIQSLKTPADPPGPGLDDPKPPIDGVPPPENPDPNPAPITVSLPEPLTLSIFATGMLGAIAARRGRKKAAN